MPTLFDRVQLRRDTAANWSSVNPILLAGEVGIETDSLKFKLGNGTDAWASLPYANQVGTAVAVTDASQITSGVFAAARIPDLSATYASTAAIAAAISPVNADLQTFKTQVPSSEDLMFVWYSGQAYGTTASAGSDYNIFTAPMAMTINSISMVWDDSSGWSTIAADDTNYWKLTLNGGGGARMVSATTQATGTDANGGITANVDWNFDSKTWATRNLNKGDLLQLVFSRGGTPAVLGMEFAVAVRYQRQAS